MASCIPSPRRNPRSRRPFASWPPDRSLATGPFLQGRGTGPGRGLLRGRRQELGRSGLGLTWYDFRHDNPATTPLTTDVWFRTANALATRVGEEEHLTGPFNYNAAPDAGGRFLGDYQGMTTIGAEFHPFFAIANRLFSCPANPTDIYTTSVRPNAPTTPAGAVAAPVQQSRTVQAPQVLRPRPEVLIR